MLSMPEPTPQERHLLIAAAIVSGLFWLGLVLLWLAAAARYFPDYGAEFQLGPPVALIILIYGTDFLRRARWLAALRGHAVAVGPKQYPDLHERLKAACKRLDIAESPTLWLMTLRSRGNGFGLRFSGSGHVVLDSELVGAFTDHQGALDFFLGRGLAQLHAPAQHLSPWLLPATVVPLLGPAYVRAQEHAADRAGLTACRAKADAALALAYVAAGSRRWKSLSLLDFAAQPGKTHEFLVSFMELISGKPWLSRRIARLHATATGNHDMLGTRHPLAPIAAALVPRAALDEVGASLRALMILIWGIMAALAVYAGMQSLHETGTGKPLPHVGNPASRPAAGAVEKSETPSENTPSAAVAYNVLYRLDVDLRRLGALAAARKQKLGGNPCEVGNIAALDLNYPSTRYAFSCDEPLVYTAIETGEFEPGRPAYLRTYNWHDGKFVEPVSRPAPEATGEPNPSTPVGR
jgi:hypothetical protein